MSRHAVIGVRWLVGCAFLVLATPAVLAGDGALTIEQVPADKRAISDDRGEEALLPKGVPSRCADPTVASEDPACLPTPAPVGESYGIPVIRDTRDDGEDLIPGVTINQGSGGRR